MSITIHNVGLLEELKSIQPSTALTVAQAIRLAEIINYNVENEAGCIEMIQAELAEQKKINTELVELSSNQNKLIDRLAILVGGVIEEVDAIDEDIDSVYKNLNSFCEVEGFGTFTREDEEECCEEECDPSGDEYFVGAVTPQYFVGDYIVTSQYDVGELVETSAAQK